MKVFIERSFNSFYKFLRNPLERKFTYFSIVYGSKRRFQESKIKFAGFDFLVPDTLSFIWQFKEIFVEEYYRFETDSNEPVIFDCGANVGTSCAFFKHIYPQSRILAFEPNPKITNYLLRNIKNNSLENIKVIEKAIWTTNDGIELGLEDADGSSIRLEKNKTKVKSVRLKDYLEKEEVVDMLKMDIEGAEIEVLKDCRESLSNVKNIFVEFHSYANEPQRLSKLIDVLESTGFRYFVMQPENRSRPFLNKTNKFNPEMDLQLNIFGYRAND